MTSALQPGMKAAFATLVLVCSACVSASEFDDLKQRYDAAQIKLAERQERVGSLGASVDEAQTRVQLLALLFDSGSAKPSSAGKSAITQIAGVLREVPNRRYQVEGHTNNVPIHNPFYRSRSSSCPIYRCFPGTKNCRSPSRRREQGVRA